MRCHAKKSSSAGGGNRDCVNENRSRQCNPNNNEYWRVRGFTERPSDWGDRMQALNRARAINNTNCCNQLNPTTLAYKKSRHLIVEDDDDDCEGDGDC